MCTILHPTAAFDSHTHSQIQVKALENFDAVMLNGATRHQCAPPSTDASHTQLCSAQNGTNEHALLNVAGTGSAAGPAGAADDPVIPLHFENASDMHMHALAHVEVLSWDCWLQDCQTLAWQLLLCWWPCTQQLNQTCALCCISQLPCRCMFTSVTWSHCMVHCPAQALCRKQQLSH